MSYIYLGSPYSHPNPEVQKARYLAVEAYCAYLMRQRYCVYSPIVHCHNLAVRHDLPGDADFWKSWNFQMIRTASVFAELHLPGWGGSKGLTAERAFAQTCLIPVQIHRLPDGLIDEATLRKLVD